MARIRNPKDFWAGVMFVGIGIAALIVSSGYSLGTAARMGPGYFPRALGILMISLGTIIALMAFRTRGEPLPRWPLRPTAIVLGSIVMFGAIVNPLGVAVSTVLLIVTASFASHEFRPLESVVAGVLLSALAVGVFVMGLHLQLPIWPAFLN